MVFMNSAVARSPSGARSSISASAAFATACASPVSDDSCTSSEADLSNRLSAGTRAPASTAITSPGTNCAASRRTNRPFRRTVAVVTSIRRNASSDASARDS